MSLGIIATPLTATLMNGRIGSPPPPSRCRNKTMASYYRKLLSDKDYYLSQANRPPRPNKFSIYRGVSKNRSDKEPYRATLSYKGKRYYLGTFATEIEAARAYNKAALAIIGDYAVINQLPE
jgi:hypothetical protein